MIDPKTIEEARAIIAKLENFIEENSWPKIAHVYVHVDKETMFSKADELGLEGDAAVDFAYALYEEKITLEVNSNGSYRITHFNDFELKV